MDFEIEEDEHLVTDIQIKEDEQLKTDIKIEKYFLEMDIEIEEDEQSVNDLQIKEEPLEIETEEENNKLPKTYIQIKDDHLNTDIQIKEEVLEMDIEIEEENMLPKTTIQIEEEIMDNAQNAIVPIQDSNIRNGQRNCKFLLPNEAERNADSTPDTFTIYEKCGELMYSKRYGCKVCKQIFPHECQVLCHVQIHRYKNPYICDMCVMRFPQREDLISHIQTHNRCNICLKTFSTDHYMSLHLETHYMDEIEGAKLKKFSCELCTQTYHTLRILVNHCYTHLEDDYYSHPCNMCSKSFYHKSQLDQHLSIHTKAASKNNSKSDRGLVANINLDGGKNKKKLLFQETSALPNQVNGHKEISNKSTGSSVSQKISIVYAQKNLCKVLLGTSTAKKICTNDTSRSSSGQKNACKDILKTSTGMKFCINDTSGLSAGQKSLCKPVLGTSTCKTSYINDISGSSGQKNACKDILGTSTIKKSCINNTSELSVVQKDLCSENSITGDSGSDFQEKGSIKDVSSDYSKGTTIKNRFQVSSDDLLEVPNSVDRISFSDCIVELKHFQMMPKWCCNYCENHWFSGQLDFYEFTTLSFAAQKIVKTDQGMCPLCYESLDWVEPEIFPDSYNCRFCDLNFPTRGALTDHLLIHTSVTPEKHFMCKVCAMVYIRSFHLVRHIKTHSVHASKS